jgi:hypothetical protein
MSLCKSFLIKLKKKFVNIKLLNYKFCIKACNEINEKELNKYALEKTRAGKLELNKRLNVLADIRNDYKKKYTELKQVKLKLKEELNELAKKD